MRKIAFSIVSKLMIRGSGGEGKNASEIEEILIESYIECVRVFWLITSLQSAKKQTEAITVTAIARRNYKNIIFSSIFVSRSIASAKNGSFADRLVMKIGIELEYGF